MDAEKAIEIILDWFDFDRVHKVMVALEWTWGSSDQKESPLPAELRRCARRLLRDVAKDEIGSKHATGGFHAINHGDSLELQFIVEDWDSNGEDQ